LLVLLQCCLSVHSEPVQPNRMAADQRCEPTGSSRQSPLPLPLLSLPLLPAAAAAPTPLARKAAFSASTQRAYSAAVAGSRRSMPRAAAGQGAQPRQRAVVNTWQCPAVLAAEEGNLHHTYACRATLPRRHILTAPSDDHHTSSTTHLCRARYNYDPPQTIPTIPTHLCRARDMPPAARRGS